MTLLLTPDTLRAAYDFLATTPPFNKWNLPDGEDVVFRVVRSSADHGWYMRDGKRHIMAASIKLVGHTSSLMQLVGHEIIHLYRAQHRIGAWQSHDITFRKLAAQVCKVHGFDPKAF